MTVLVLSRPEPARRQPTPFDTHRMIYWCGLTRTLGFLLAGGLLLAGPVTAQPVRSQVSDYRVSFGEVVYQNKPYLILRRFRLDGQPHCLLVDSQTLTTLVVPTPATPPATDRTLADVLRTRLASTYSRALTTAQLNAKPSQDAGITHALPAENGVVLTIDLCPSRKPLDRVIFTKLLGVLGRTETPVPLALSVTGVWMRDHPDDLAWVREQINRGLLAVTWINHSFNHRVSPTLPLNENFLLEPGTNLTDEVLQTEMALLANGLTPSVFFRFPGLISDESLVGRISAFGLIVVGSDAWLAKGQQPGRGSIVLIHGNGNEPVGVRDFLRLLRRHQADIQNRDWLLYDLRTGVD